MKIDTKNGSRRRNRGLQLTLTLFAFAGSCALANFLLVEHEPLAKAFGDTAIGYDVDIVEPAVQTNKRKQTSPGFAPPKGEECTTGCSLAKHSVPEFTLDDFYVAMDAYAASDVGGESEALDTLLFYGQRTEDFLASEGGEPLSAAHLAFLKRELRRKNAVVTIRMVDEHGKTRVTYGPVKVPFGEKQHLAPAEVGNLFAMEFNGTVMRTGLYHLWSRY